MGLEDDPRLVGRQVEDSDGVSYLIIAIIPLISNDGSRSSEVKLKSGKTDRAEIFEVPPENLTMLQSAIINSGFKLI